ncbi:MAG: small basic family protein [bacterium]|nr:small basic family protein [bacterium]
MWYGLIGLAIGIILGIYTPLTIPIEYARYTAVGIMGILDSVFGAIRGDLQGRYNATVFVSGLITNMFLAIIITFLGDRLGIDLYLAIIVAFTIRMLNNIGIIRYFFLSRFMGKKEVETRLKAKAELE